MSRSLLSRSSRVEPGCRRLTQPLTLTSACRGFRTSSLPRSWPAESIATAGHVDPVTEYLTCLDRRETPRALETVWPGEVVVYDPRAGEVRGHRQLRRFVKQNQARLAERHASTRDRRLDDGRRAGGRRAAGAIWTAGRAGRGALAAGRRRRVTRRSVGGVPHLLQPVAGRRTAPHQAAHPRRRATPIRVTWSVATRRPSTPATPTRSSSTFAPDGYFREPSDRDDVHRGARELHAYFSRCFSAGGASVSSTAP